MKNNRTFSRTVEGMGEKLVQFKIESSVKDYSNRIHLFFENGRKPPLDIAICLSSMKLEYLSFFAMNEKITEKEILVPVVYEYERIDYQKMFDLSKKTNEDFKRKSAEQFQDFELFLSESNLFLMCLKHECDYMRALHVGEEVYLLFSNLNEFYGVVFKCLSKDELNSLESSFVI